jgi:hypothetical protein
MEGSCSSETFVRGYNPEGHNHDANHRGKLETSCKLLPLFHSITVIDVQKGAKGKFTRILNLCAT